MLLCIYSIQMSKKTNLSKEAETRYRFLYYVRIRTRVTYERLNKYLEIFRNFAFENWSQKSLNVMKRI